MSKPPASPQPPPGPPSQPEAAGAPSPRAALDGAPGPDHEPPALGLDGEDRERDSDEWAHVDPAHPRPWEGCIRRSLCCRRSPGWFAPGEAERAAAFVGLTMGELVNRYLILDHHETTIGRIEAFAPVRLAPDGEPVEPPGGRVTAFYHLGEGPCVLFDGQGCSIYPARPLECRLYDCTHLPEDNPRRIDIALLWLGAWKASELGVEFDVGSIESCAELRRLAQRARELMRAGSDPDAGQKENE